MKNPEFYLEEFSRHLKKYKVPETPENLYTPMEYILGLGGKRIRPVLALMAAELNGGKFQDALPAAMSIEVFHNFSLVHDDIMDDAPLRRGQSTVHNRWNINTGILSGDVMLIKAYQFLEEYPPETFKKLSTIFSATATAVCEGQQLDMDFETRDNVSLENYLQMITNKTAVLLGAAMEMGAVVASASAEVQNICFEIGRDLGIAFQIQDDYLDVFGDPDVFGKQVGGDILESKKTYLYITTLENANTAIIDKLKSLYENSNLDPLQKVREVTDLYTNSGVGEIAAAAIETYTRRAFRLLDNSAFKDRDKELFKNFALGLMGRTS